MIKSSVENSINHSYICHNSLGIRYDIESSGKYSCAVSPVEYILDLIEEVGPVAGEVATVEVADRGGTVDAEGYESIVGELHYSVLRLTAQQHIVLNVNSASC